MERTIGFIGGGNMCGAILGGMLRNGIVPPESVMVSDRNQKSLQTLSEKYKVKTTNDNRMAAEFADILFLSVKPNICCEVIREIRPVVNPKCVVVSIAAGLSLSILDREFEREIPIVRVMPNTPALAGEGMAAVCGNHIVTKGQMDAVLTIFRSFGRAEFLEEKLFDVVTAVSGSSPAYVYLFIEAMADAAVAGGMPRALAYTFCAQAVAGSARMVLETGKHPGELKDMVCSPGGTTIDAVLMLEQKGMRAAVQSAVKACMEKSASMGRRQD